MGKILRKIAIKNFKQLIIFVLVFVLALTINDLLGQAYEDNDELTNMQMVVAYIDLFIYVSSMFIMGVSVNYLGENFSNFVEDVKSLKH